MNRSWMPFIFVALFSSSMLCAQETIHWRNGCPNAFAKFKASQTTKAYTKISFFGGATLADETGYRSQIMKRVNADYPGAVLSQNTASIADTGAWLGAFRTRNEALYGGAALVMIDFTEVDHTKSAEENIAALEGIVRQIWSRDHTCDIVFLYTHDAQGYEQVAEHYQIPSINLTGIPTNTYFTAIAPFLDKGKAEYANSTPAVHEWHKIKPLTDKCLFQAQCMPYEWAKADAGWHFGQTSTARNFYHLAVCSNTAATLTFSFSGTEVGVFNLPGGSLLCSLDQGPWTKIDLATTGTQLAKNLDPKVTHTVSIRPATETPVTLGAFLVNGDVKNPFSGADKRAEIDALYASMKPVEFTPLPNRWDNLAKTRERLQKGGELNIVMLGDSIIGDTYSSHYWLALQRLYPKCKINVKLSNRGSTGCWWYKNDNQVESYVLRYTPDLLIIGGISQRDDVASIREVIHQVRQKQNPEILLLTQVFGATRDKHISQWTYDPQPGTYRADLKKLAEEEKCGYFDMTGIWWKYVLDSGKCYGWFMRDVVHANERGFQIIGRMLEKNFAP